MTTKRDTALIGLAGFFAMVYVAAIVALAVTNKVDGKTAISALSPIGPLAGFALGRLSGGPAPIEGNGPQPEPLPQRVV